MGFHIDPLILKGGAVFTLSTAVVGTVGFVANNLSETKKEATSIRILLTKSRPDKRLLVKGRPANDSAWRTAWSGYIDIYSDSEEDPFSVTSFSQGDAPIDFIDGCEALFKESVVDDKDERYQLALKFCTRDTLVSDFIWEKGKQYISDKGDSAWQELWNDYRSNASNVWGLTENTQTPVPNSFKNKCIEVSTSKASKMDDVNVTMSVRYCSKNR